MRKYYRLLFVLILLFSLSSVLAQEDILTQVSTIDALLNGIYEGEITLNELKQYGDFGLGTFNYLDGEMVFLDGRFYQITSEGIAKIPDSNTKTPFAAVTFFEADQELQLRSGMDYQTFIKEMDNIIPTLNIFYAIRIKGLFQAVKTRSVPKQEKPYQPLTDIVKTQPVFNFENLKGIIVGFRCPTYVKGINVPGYHLHFLTADGKAGGHVLDFTLQRASLEIDQTSEFFMILPHDKYFYNMDLSLDKEEDLKKVEK